MRPRIGRSRDLSRPWSDSIRLFAYGSVSVVLVFYLVGAGLSEPRIGTLLSLTLAGDTLVSLYLTTRADRIG